MVEEMSVKKYVRSEEEWIYVLSQNDYFGYGAPDHDSTQQASRELNDCRGPSNFGFWMDNLRNFGTINIFYILGMGHLDNPIEGFFGKHLEREHIVSQLRGALHECRKADIAWLNSLPANANNQLGIRQRIYDKWDKILADALFRMAYASFMTIEEHWEYSLKRANGNVEEQIPLAQAISQQRRYHQHRREANFDRCRHCESTEHFENQCTMGGYMYADENGNPTFDGIVGKPRCYVCARRYPVIIIRVGEEVHKIVHCSANCPYRHPESYQGVNRRCVGCRGWLLRCWNCAEVICGRGIGRTQQCRGHQNEQSQGHKNRCPHPRYQPILSELRYGFNAEKRLKMEERLRELGILRAPRELVGTSAANLYKRGSNLSEELDGYRRFLVAAGRLAFAQNRQQNRPNPTPNRRGTRPISIATIRADIPAGVEQSINEPVQQANVASQMSSQRPTISNAETDFNNNEGVALNMMENMPEVRQVIADNAHAKTEEMALRMLITMADQPMGHVEDQDEFHSCSDADHSASDLEEAANLEVKEAEKELISAHSMLAPEHQASTVNIDYSLINHECHCLDHEDGKLLVRLPCCHKILHVDCLVRWAETCKNNGDILSDRDPDGGFRYHYDTPLIACPLCREYLDVTTLQDFPGADVSEEHAEMLMELIEAQTKLKTMFDKEIVEDLNRPGCSYSK